MRKIKMAGYIDDDMWYGDEITPENVHGMLYGEKDDLTDDVQIMLDSYGGSCHAATKIYDDIKAYGGQVHIVISGTAASAATVIAQAADKLEMTPGSMFMIHDPSTIAIGNEKDMMDTIGVLRACKESILNIYEKRSHEKREDIAQMMTDATWMDAKAALERGFIDGIAESKENAPTNAAFNREEAAKRVNAWKNRERRPENKAKEPEKGQQAEGIKVSDLMDRLNDKKFIKE